MEIEKRELLSLDDVENIGIDALMRAFEVIKELGPRGEERIHKNQFNETALRADVEAEQAVIEVLRQSGIPIVIDSEEHKVVLLSNQPQYYAVLDGVDGSVEYETTHGQGRYGSMLGIFQSENPTYGDYLFQGIMEHATQSLYFAVKGKSAFLKTSAKISQISTSGSKRLDQNTRVYFSENDFDTFGADKTPFLHVLHGIRYTRLGSTESHYADLASGRVDVVIEPSRKGNLEPAAAYGLIVEAGGAIGTIQGEFLRDKKFKEFGQKESVPLIATATPELFHAIIQRLSNRH
jgi:fructose-1,6-bisphosphatase/inositol monophosphatase family enzyme